MLIRKAGTMVAGTLLALGTVAVATPGAGAAPAVDNSTEVTFTCNATGSNHPTVSPSTFQTSAPAEVAPGEFFTVTIQPGQMRSGSSNMARLSLDVGLPTNAEIVDLKLVGGGQNLGSGVQVTRVNAGSKTNDAAGTVARIWGGNSARYGTSSGNGNNPLTVSSNRDFQLPALEATLRAPSQVGAVMETGLPGAGNSPNNAANSDLQWVQRTTFGGNYGECSAGSEASVLTSTVVGDLDPVVLPTTTALSADPTTVGPNQSTTLTATVQTDGGLLKHRLEGTDVVFRDADSGDELGTATVGSDGRAHLDTTVNPSPGDSGVRTIVAEYLGVPGDLGASTSAPVTVNTTTDPTVEYDTRLDLRAELGDEVDGAVPVNVVAKINRPAGPAIPEGAQLQLYRNGQPIGDPQVLPAGNEISWTDTVPRDQRTKTHTYQVKFTPVTVDYQTWTGGTSAPVSVIVTGTDPNLDPSIIGETGSLDIGGFFNDLMIQMLVGSLGN